MTLDSEAMTPDVPKADTPTSLSVGLFGASGSGKETLRSSLQTGGTEWDIQSLRLTDASIADLVGCVIETDHAILVTRPGKARRETQTFAALLAILKPGAAALVVTGMDAVDFSELRFRDTTAQLLDLGLALSRQPDAIPVSGIEADNVLHPSSRMPWYSGPTLFEWITQPRSAVEAGEAAQAADQFETTILWLAAKPMVSGRQYRFEAGTWSALCAPERPKYRIERDTHSHLAARVLSSGESGVVNIALDRDVPCQPTTSGHSGTRFVLSDRRTGNVVGVGVVHFALRRSTNVRPQNLSVTPASRAALKGHEPCVLWFTGLSGAGKSTVSNLVEIALNNAGRHTVLLDGDNVRHGLNRDLGFTEADRAENIRRIAEVARLMTDAGLIVLVSFISPFAAERGMARQIVGTDRFLEIFVDAPLEVVEARDVKGLYRRARKGEIQNFTGIDSPYEQPESPDLHLRTDTQSADEGARQVLELLHGRKFMR